MKIGGSKQRLCIGGWVLAALVMIGLNAFRFMSLEQLPLVGYSQTIKAVQSRLQDFDRTVATGIFTLKDHIIPISAGGSFFTNSKTAKRDDDGKGPQDIRIADAAESVLPTLSGILQTLDLRGSVYYRAVLNGQVCGEQDKINEFTVVKISPTAVVVRRAGRKWTLDGPTPYFSSDQGE
jgi:hypothetical protein